MDLLDKSPLWVVFAFTAIIVSLAFEGGFQAGLFAKSKEKVELNAPVGAMVGVVLSLSAFILAFTFGVAAERFNDRRVLVIEEANSIGTTFLRSNFLPEQNRKEVQDLLRQYVGVRQKLAHDFDLTHDYSVVAVAVAAAEAEQIQDRLWAQATTVGNNYLDSDVIALFIDSLNDTIDLQSKRIAAGMRARLPKLVWIALYLLITLSMFGLGYQFGFAGKRNWPITSVTVLSLAIVILLIADLDRPLDGFLQTSKQPLNDLAKKLGVGAGGNLMK